MEEKHERGSYLAWTLLITGFTFLLFTLFSSLVHGFTAQFFGWTGLISFSLGLLTGSNILLKRSRRKNRNHLAP